MQYLLEYDDVIKQGDWQIAFCTMEWNPVNENLIGRKVCESGIKTPLFRRKISELEESQNPTTNKASTKLLNELEHLVMSGKLMVDTKFDRAMEIFEQLRT